MISSPPPRRQAHTGSTSLDALVSAKPAPLHHFRLDNGLSVYLHEDHSTPLAAVQLWYHVGSSHEPPGHSNLSHLLEHLIFQGSRKLPAGQYSRLIARLGGVANATTHDDATSFEMSLPATRLPIALEIMADAMQGANPEPAAFAQEVKAVADERRLRVDNSPIQLAFEQHRKLAHEDNAYGVPSFGYPVDLQEMSLASVRTWYRTWYQPNNATLVVAGAINPQALRQQVDTYFAALPPAPLRDKSAPRHSTVLAERSQTLVQPTLVDGLFMSFNVPSQATAPSRETALALRLLWQILGVGYSARLYNHLVRDKRILTRTQLTYDHHVRGDTLLTLSASTVPQRATAQQAATQVWQLIDTLRSAALPHAVLEGAKLRLLATRLYERDDLAHQATLIGHAAAAGLDPALLAEEPGIIRDLASSTLQRVASEYLSRERLTTTYLQQGVPA
ncbi:pitrilysin family protein [Pseudomonas putida]|uniref:M16 family metallopeptidase n=1 Tax=Pseudomonas putida TaxID=303 RepID=UPI00301D7889